MTTTMIDRLPPSSIDTERALLGSVFLDPIKILQIDLHGTEFVDSDFGHVFEHIKRLALGSFPVNDDRLLIQSLKDAMLWAPMGGAEMYAQLVSDVPNAAHGPYYAQIIRRCAQARKLIGCATHLLNESYRDDCVPTDLAASSIRSIEQAITESSIDVVTLEAMIESEVDSIRCAMNADKIIGLQTGLHTLDSHIGGLHDGDLVILAARPSIGKTAMGLSIACNVSEAGKQVLFFSLEMTSQDIAQRLLSRQTGLSVQRIRQGQLNEQEFDCISTARHQIKKLSLRPICKPRLTVSQMMSMCRAHASRYGLDLVVVDYLGLIRNEGRSNGRYEAITQISNDIQAMTKTLGKPVICLSQLNRGAEGETPKLDHLRDSGAIEQDADMVWLLDRERDSSEAWLIIAKARQGQVGKLALSYNKTRCSFTDEHTKASWDPDATYSFQ